jgi:cell division protein ZapA
MPKKEAPAPPGYTTVSIYDQAYHLMGQDTGHIKRLAEQVDAKMRAVAAQGRTVDSLRVAVLAALNLADELAQATGGASVSTSARDGHARAITLTGLLDEVLEDDSPENSRKTGS